MYIPTNLGTFTAAYAGAIAGMAVNGWIVDPTAADYANPTNVAGAFAQEFDTVWNNASPLNNLEAGAITAVVQNEFAGRGVPNASPTLLLASTWQAAAAACVALVTECDAYFAASGITPVAPFTYWRPLSSTTYFVDPQNVSGNASDSNTGTTAGAPFRSTAKMNSILFFGLLVGNTTITYLSDDQVDLPSQYAALDFSLTNGANRYTLSVVGTSQVVYNGGTFDAGTVALNPASNLGQVVHTTDITNWATYIPTAAGPFFWIKDVVSGAIAPILAIGSGAAPNTVDVGAPKNANGTAGTFTIGHAYQILRGSHLGVSGISTTGPDGYVPGTSLIGGTQLNVSFSNIAFTVNSRIPNGANLTLCSMVGSLTAGIVGNNCLFYGINANAPVTLYGGGLVTATSDTLSAVLTLGDDACVTGYGLILSGSNYAGLVIGKLHNAHPSAQFHDTSGPGALIVLEDAQIGIVSGVSSAATDGLIWGGQNGPGDNVNGVAIGPGATLTVTLRIGSAPKLTGNGTDFVFLTTANGQTNTARAWNESTGAWSASFTAFWGNLTANLDQAQDVGTNAAIIGVLAVS